jgi:hypothetical protein
MMRAMRLLQVAPARLRTMRLEALVNVRTTLELAAAERDGVSLDEAVPQLTFVQLIGAIVVQTGGRVGSVQMSGGRRVVAGEQFTPDELARYGIDPARQVWFGFDVDIEVLPPPE